MGDLQDLWDEVTDAVEDAISNAEGRPNNWHLEHSFNKAGLGVFRLPDDPPYILAALKASQTREQGFSSLLRRWLASDAGAWHPERYERDRSNLAVETRAALASAGKDEESNPQPSGDYLGRDIP